MSKPTVVVGMSGGVDSSVAALLLKQQGYSVIGLFMKNWEEVSSDNLCTAAADYEDVARVCEVIGIPYYSVNFATQYWDQVFAGFIDELKRGLTPNPDILCNREIKFNVLMKKAKELGGDFLATGHYCQTDPSGHLLRGLDPGKDQSYFLYTLKKEILQKVLFPIGALHKAEVRRIAKENNLVTSEKKDSVGICFIGKRNFKEFVANYVPYHPGNFETTDGAVVGRHDGAAYYTIGQRRGLGIGGEGDAWFVVGKDMESNIVQVVQGGNHPALYHGALTATDLSWVDPAFSPELPYQCTAKIRYRQQDEEAFIEKIEGDRVWVRFTKLQRAITPRQSIVFYQGSVCLGGAMIEARTSGLCQS